jgi:hypothetical protein
MFDIEKADVIAKYQHAIAVIHEAAPTAKWNDGRSIGLERYYPELDRALRWLTTTNPGESLDAWREWADEAIARFRHVADILSVVSSPAGRAYYEFYNNEANRIRAAFDAAYRAPPSSTTLTATSFTVLGVVLFGGWWLSRKE